MVYEGGGRLLERRGIFFASVSLSQARSELRLINYWRLTPIVSPKLFGKKEEKKAIKMIEIFYRRSAASLLPLPPFSINSHGSKLKSNLTYYMRDGRSYTGQQFQNNNKLLLFLRLRMRVNEVLYSFAFLTAAVGRRR